MAAPQVYNSYDDLVADPDIDIIYIGTKVRTEAICHNV